MPYKYLSVWAVDYEGETLYKVLFGKDGEEPIRVQVPKDGTAVNVVPEAGEWNHLGNVELPSQMGVDKSCSWLKTRPGAATDVFNLEQYIDRMDRVDELTDGGIEWGSHDPLEESEVPA